MDTLKNAILNGLYDKHYRAHEMLSPRLLGNGPQNKLWLTLRGELESCQSFTWAVAFITEDMLVPFKLAMADLAAAGVYGTLITGDYLGFNSPKVFHELRKIPNLTVKISQTRGFHVKAYLFDHGGYQTVIIGSANFTRSALLGNCEWALRVSSGENAALTRELNGQLTRLKKQSIPLTSQWIAAYRRHWVPPIRPRQRAVPQSSITPNKMQTAALKELSALVRQGARRGLVVSATGTGKTYLGALAVRDFKPRRFLYLVHREQIARKSMASFRRVIGGPQSDYGMLTGNRHDLNAKYLFATVQTVSRPAMLAQLPAGAFDYILIDEAHRVAAPSYQRILRHFTPRFMLGMTATPERMDNQDVYAAFDYHLAYEIRLKEALEEDMLAPFHYVGVQDYEADGEVIDETSNLSRLVASARVRYVLSQMDYYGYCGKKPRGLVFCSRQAEARSLAEQFTMAGHPAAALTNEDRPVRRQLVVRQLEQGEIEYIVTVDLFNEGVDIPALNQIVMLRNTQSSIIFLQQLGRGLRKYPGKDYVTVLDFIGNYKNNYLIPLALNGDNSRSQDRARAETRLPGIIGVSTINFNRVASAHILASLAKVKLDSMRELRQAYCELHNKLGRVPYLNDFLSYGTVSPLVFAGNSRLPHYGAFLQKMGEQVQLSRYESQVLSFVTKELLNGKRPHELVLLKLLLAQGSCSQEKLLAALQRRHAYVNAGVLQSIADILSLGFFDVKAGKTTGKNQYGGQALVVCPDLLNYQLSARLREELDNNADFAKLFTDAIETGLKISEHYDAQQQFTLYRQYSRKDVCRLLNWPLDVSAPMYGYRVGKHDCPIFITYHKEDREKRNAIYNNELRDGQSLRWYTRSPRHLDSAEVQRLLAGIEEGNPKVRLLLFVKRSDAVGKEFYYLGTAQIDPTTVKEEQLGPKKKAVVGMDLILDSPLTPRMYKLLFE